MELEEIKELVALLKDTDITELQIEREGTKFRIKREKHYGHLEIHPPLHAEKRVAQERPQEAEGKLFTVTSPIIGTFYRSPSPEADPYVDIGTRVKKGQVLCLIEAMKLMNEIESEVDGVVMRVLIENGHPVEYGEPLFLIDPL